MAFLEANEPENADEIKESLMVELLNEFDKQVCQHQEHTVDNQSENQAEKQQLLKSERSCHIYNDLKAIFGDLFNEYDKLKNKKRRVKEAQFLVMASLGTVILLLTLKVIALMNSNSMALLTSFMDNLLDCLSGIILLLSSFLAKKGIQYGEYQRYMHQPQLGKKYVYSNRFEGLGVLVFAVMMGTISAILIKESFEEVISISNHEGKEMKFDAFS